MSMRHYSGFKNCSAAVSVALLLTACGGDGASTGYLNVGVTDAPVDSADAVVVEFDGVELQPANGPRISFDFTERCEQEISSCQINLLQLTGGTSESILDNEVVPSGRYNWMRLMVNAEPNVTDSYIIVNGQQYELRIPSGDERGLQLNRHFIVPAGGVADFTIDFDLRKSVHDPVGSLDYILRPTLRIVDNTEVGTLSGSVDSSFFSSGTCSGAVYVFNAGTEDAPDDEDGEAGGPDPITSAMVPDDGAYKYKVAFLSEGDYHIAFTCDADGDDPAVDDNSDTVKFLSEATVPITAGSTTNYDFPLASPMIAAGERYPVHRNIKVSTFWVGEEPGPDNGYVDNKDSAWDNDWMERFGGFDDPDNRNGYYPAGFVPLENPFYFALPFFEFGENGFKPIVYELVPWVDSNTPLSEDESLLKNRWIKITKDNKVVYAQWEDAGPFTIDDYQYVFGSARPLLDIGLDTSPAVRDYLGLEDVDTVDWKFVDEEDVPDGPWKTIVTTSQLNWY